MGHGRPSWDKYRSYGSLYEEVEAGELAVRLGSPVTFDRRGRVLWYDTFERGLGAWVLAEVGAGSVPHLTTETCRTTGVAVKIEPGAFVGDISRMSHFQPYPALGKFGNELSFSLADSYCKLHLQMYVYTGSQFLRAEARYDRPAQKLEYRDSAGAWQTLASGLLIYPEITLFHTLKLVVDFATQKYSRLIFNASSYLLSSYAIAVAASAVEPQMITRITGEIASVGAGVIYVDDVIITQNEP